jgi:hypothetical protein
MAKRAFAEQMDRLAHTGTGARRFDVVLPHSHPGESNSQQSVLPQPFAGDHARADSPRPAVEAALRPLYVEGYPGQMSYEPGDTLSLHVSSSAPSFELEIARIGYEVTIAWRSEPKVACGAHDVAENASSHGCGWPAAISIPVPDRYVLS